VKPEDTWQGINKAMAIENQKSRAHDIMIFTNITPLKYMRGR
jgi:hypothetical protein